MPRRWTRFVSTCLESSCASTPQGLAAEVHFSRDYDPPQARPVVETNRAELTKLHRMLGI